MLGCKLETEAGAQGENPQKAEAAHGVVIAFGFIPTEESLQSQQLPVPFEEPSGAAAIPSPAQHDVKYQCSAPGAEGGFLRGVSRTRELERDENQNRGAGAYWLTHQAVAAALGQILRGGHCRSATLFCSVGFNNRFLVFLCGSSPTHLMPLPVSESQAILAWTIVPFNPFDHREQVRWSCDLRFGPTRLAF